MIADWDLGYKIRGRYLIQDIKRGGMGVVYICYDEFAQKYLALKTFQLSSPQDLKLILKNFIREARTWISIGPQHHVVEAYYILNLETEYGILPLIAMEFIKGDKTYGASLEGWIRKAGLTIELVLLFAIDICSGMIQIQKKLSQLNREFIHRDLKPQNILISHEGSLKITDFGIAKVFNELLFVRNSFPTSSLTPSDSLSFGITNFICGTPPYMSPEQCIGQRTIDQRSDIYSFGCILYEMCTGHYIFKAGSSAEFISKHIADPPIPINNWNSDFPNDLIILIERCLSKVPSDRPCNFEEIRSILKSILNKMGPSRGLLFFTFGLSGLTEKPRLKTDWGMKKEDEIYLLGSVLGIDYLIENGLILRKEEFENIQKEHQIRIANAEEKENRERMNKVSEYALAGDSYIRLAESAENDEKINLIRSAISQYNLAKELIPNDSRIIFRLGLANCDLARIIRGRNETLSDDLIALSIEEYNAIMEEQRTPILDEIGDVRYLLPFHAMYYRGLSYLVKEDWEKGAEDFKGLFLWLKNSNIPEFNSYIKIIGEKTAEVFQAVLGEMNKRGLKLREID